MKEFFEYCGKYKSQDKPLFFEVFDNWNDDTYYPTDFERQQEVELDGDDVEIMPDHVFITLHGSRASKLIKGWNEKYKRFYHAKVDNLKNQPAKLFIPMHGIDCRKVPHLPNWGYLHTEEYNGSYDVDGVEYCGRCHSAMEIPVRYFQGEKR